MITNNLISIIIPFYNTKKEFFNRCINSLAKQTCQDYEVIIVNDGSSVEYTQQLDIARNKINNLRIINKKNEGSAIARNVGVLEAKGNYIMFLDADDALTEYCISEAIDAINHYNSDIVFGLTQRTSEDLIDSIIYTETRESFAFDDEKNKNDLLCHMLGYRKEAFIFNGGYISDGPWCRIVRTDIAKKSLFSAESFWNDDSVWNIKIFKDCYKIVVVKDLWYKYLVYTGSKIRRYRPNCPNEFSYRTKQELDLGKELWPEAMDGIYNRVFNDIIMLARTFLFHPENPMSRKEKYLCFKHCIHQEAYFEAARNCDFSYDKGLKRLFKKAFSSFIYRGPNIFSYWLLRFFIATKKNI